MLQTLLFISTVIQITDCFIGPYLFRPDQPLDFSISVNDNYTGEASLCIRVFCSFTVPQRVLDSEEPIRRTWIKGDPQNPTVEVPSVDFGVSYGKAECNFLLKNLVQGQNDGDYRLKLEWGHGNVHIFNKTVRIIVKELTEKPTIEVPLLTAGEKAEISCRAPGTCLNPKMGMFWEGIEPERTERKAFGVIGREDDFLLLIFHPKPEHHNINLTCRVIFQENMQTEATVTLEVRHAPKISNSSRCVVWGDELICVCVSGGFPLPDIYWSPLDDVTEYYIAFSNENTFSIISISTASFRNLNMTIVCISMNPIGLETMEIQVDEKLKASWKLPTSWIFFSISLVLNISLASCLIVTLRRKGKPKPQDDNRVYISPMKSDESVYETIQMSSESS
uniref:sialic acid-binding Ig-like lectin 8 precursor n=1 Tax=Danio rerio TaxID=7955 RepID=UPI0004F41707|nr:sialic acid-binding Ig-like lectin 12 isoform X1 [Danio rerio]|eukprot:XP_021322141.1 sialic acid-binding Ig-like lectin 12 isoform X1 [Danio rerio]